MSWRPRRAAAGSSPLARGLRMSLSAVDPDFGIIPARAGFTGRRATVSTPRLDHPRSRGVYIAIRRRTWRTCGSSPLARGLRRRAGVPRQARRIIPARAGFTGPGTWPVRRPWDHPRSRGVYAARAVTIRLTRGSSPLARGLRPYAHVDGRIVGIIPARAGFTAWTAPWSSTSTDHPRSRGVYRTTDTR